MRHNRSEWAPSNAEMKSMAAEDPSQEVLLVLHEALLGGDIAASVSLAELLLPAMLRRFDNRRDLERHEIESIIGLCIATYLSLDPPAHSGRSFRSDSCTRSFPK